MGHKTLELADEICTDCNNDSEKVDEIYNWITTNFEYDYGYNPVVPKENLWI